MATGRYGGTGARRSSAMNAAMTVPLTVLFTTRDEEVNIERSLRLSMLAVLAMAVAVAARPDGLFALVYPADYLPGAPALAILIFAYVAFYLQAFVVPLMHRYRIGALEAWRRFFSIWSANPLPFVVVGLVVIVGFVAFATLAIVFGLMTCCVGFLFLLAPYLSNVLMLPATVFYRAFTVEFLAQFDTDLLGPNAGEAPAPQAA